MPKYQVLSPTFIGQFMQTPTIGGDLQLPNIIEFAGVPGPHLKPVDDAANARVAALSALERRQAGYTV